ncbi:AAA family ATPase [Streptomyces daliensis]|uniref:AAA family ATPase n=1 Tax=Streptomyces daliensis TaxID=299421 RepID=A0A8T4J2I6_9ACTN|nr:AAA family ATPase [Streptomyces daliensis]
MTRERAYARVCRDAMARTVADAQERVTSGAGVVREEGVSGDGASAEALGRALRSWAKELREEPEAPLFFGRLDFSDRDATPETGHGTGPGTPTDAAHEAQRYYIGRRRVAEHPAAPPLVLDWRAPVSRAFYQATAAQPRGVAVRRRFGWAPGSRGAPEDLTGLEDEHLTPHDGDGTHTGTGTGEAPASAIVAGEIERPRVGPMRDIVATIQPEQDDLVRGGLAESFCVQGAPGTGKTAVGLHRAAYLLYTHPRRIARGGLLVLGPNEAFLRYISQVLPSLGEVGVRQCTVGDLVARHPAVAEDGEEAARVKHDPRMAAVLRRSLYGRVRAPEEPLVVPDGSYRWRVDAGELARLVELVEREDPPYEVGRERVRARVVALLRDRAERRAGPPGAEWLRRMGRARAVTAFLDAVWPKARPEEVLAQLLGDAGELSRSADGLLTGPEQRALLWERAPRTFRGARWSRADLVLLDEVAGLIGRPEESYGHVVVDEAQDLSPMECRVIARRSEYGSLTVLGDLAQGTTPWAAARWPEQLAHLGRPEARVVPLTTGFRVPRAIVAAANALLDSLDVPVPPARSLRGDGELRVREVPDLARATAEAVREALTRAGSVAVIAADEHAEAARAALTGAGFRTTSAEEIGGEARVTVLPASAAKGLEYDHVILLEPSAIVAAEPRGAHRLYVVLTRAVSRLDILHTAPLPAALTGMTAPSTVRTHPRGAR